MKILKALKFIKNDIVCMWKGFSKICAIKVRCPELNIYTYNALVKSIEKRNDTCHIIASGYSAVDAYKRNIMQKDDYIIGFNFAAFLPYQFDFYFCENGKQNDMEVKLSRDLITLLSKRIDNISNVVFKNIYSANLSYLKRLYNSGIGFSVVFDRQLYSADRYQELFKKPSYFMPQYASTVITSVMLAYHAGFKNIIIHGLDFVGPHLYHDEELQSLMNMNAPTPYMPLTEKHLTANDQELVWGKLINCFEELGVEVYCASDKSRFSTYAPVYQAKKDTSLDDFSIEEEDI